MASGGCLCGDVRVSYVGEPAGNALCHCVDCRKISGGAYSMNILVPEANWRVEKGTPKTYAKKADSGATIVSYICDTCGTTLWRETPSFEGIKISKTGIYDTDVVKETPILELYTKQRLPWVKPLDGAKQAEGMS